MECRITTLAENTAGAPQTFAEWGFSALIEADGKSILMDTGLGHAITHNAELLDVDLKKIDVIVLSHGHADHTGDSSRYCKVYAGWCRSLERLKSGTKNTVPAEQRPRNTSGFPIRGLDWKASGRTST